VIRQVIKMQLASINMW